MTTTPEPQSGMDPVMATILTAQIQQAQFAENAVHAANERRLREMQENYVALYMSMEKVFSRTDSATARDALDSHSYVFGSVVTELNEKESY